MKSGLIGGQWIVGVAIVGAALASGGAALADEGGGEEAAHAEVAKDQPVKHGEHGEHEARPWRLYADFVLGFSKVPVAFQQQGQPGGSNPQPRFSADSAKVTTESFILGLGYAVTHNIAIGARIPFTFGGAFPAAGSESTTAFGALELEGEYEKHMNKDMSYAAVLGISLPTAQGNEIQDAAYLQSQQPGAVDKNAFDRWSIGRAASLARGSEDVALFEPKRFGINPKVAFDINAAQGKVVFTPYLKWENLIATGGIPHNCGSGGSACGYLGEIIPALKLAYHSKMNEHMTLMPALRFWANFAYAGIPNGEDSVVAALEPQVALRVDNVHSMLGVILPLAGPGKLGGDEPAVGVRLALGGHF
jgi:hypothetical protein